MTHFQINARGNQSIYQAVEEFFGSDYWHIDIVQVRRNQITPDNLSADRVVIGSTTAHANSGPWFALTAPRDMADEIEDRHRQA